MKTRVLKSSTRQNDCKFLASCEQVAYQYFNIASQYCGVVRKSASGLTLQSFSTDFTPEALQVRSQLPIYVQNWKIGREFRNELRNVLHNEARYEVRYEIPTQFQIWNVIGSCERINELAKLPV